MCYVGFILAALKTRFTDGPILDLLQYFDIHLSAQVTYIQYIFYILVLKYISDVGYCWHRGPQSAQFAVGADIQSNYNIHALRNIWICKLSNWERVKLVWKVQKCKEFFMFNFQGEKSLFSKCFSKFYSYIYLILFRWHRSWTPPRSSLSGVSYQAAP